VSKLFTDNLSHTRAKAIRGVLGEKPDLSSNLALADFLSEYFLCEALANKLIEYFEADVPPEAIKPKKTKCPSCGVENEISLTRRKPTGRFKSLDVGKIKKALVHFALDFPPDGANAVFASGSGIVGERTARQLRNDYAHSLSSSANKEITARAPQLLNLMIRFHMAVQSRTSLEST
jgi:hypothetical protein